MLNKLNLPEPFIKACEAYLNEYDLAPNKLTISASQLNDSPYIRIMRRESAGMNLEDKRDVADELWKIFGTVVHAILEKAGPSYIKELRTTKPTGRLVIQYLTGKVDLLKPSDGELTDYKVTSVWQVMGKELNQNYVAQINVNAYLLRKSGYKIEKLQLVYLFRDWSRQEYLRRQHDGYPEEKAQVIPVVMWNDLECADYISRRLDAHEQAEFEYMNGTLKHCSKEERWATEDKWAVMKEGNKKASKICINKEEAEEYIDSKSGVKGVSSLSYEIIFRPGEDKRCEYYCELQQVCSYYINKKKEKNYDTNRRESNIQRPFGHLDEQQDICEQFGDNIPGNSGTFRAIP